MTADPNWTDAVRNQIFKRLGFALGMQRVGHILAQWCHPQNAKWLIHMRNGDEGDGDLSNWVITDGKIGTDTDAAGLVYGTLTDGGAGTGHSIDLYNDSGRSTKVSATASVDDNNTATLTAESGFTLAGTVDVAAISGNITFAFYLVPPAIVQLGDLFNEDESDDQENEAATKAQLRACYNAALSFKAAGEAMGAQLARTLLTRRLVSHSGSQLINDGIRRLSTGQITENATGILEDLRLAMQDNTGGSGAIKATLAAFSGATAIASGWDATLTTETYNIRAVPGVITFTCDKGLDGRPPTFTVRFAPDDRRRKANLGRDDLVAREKLTMGVTWKAPEWGIESFKIDYKASVSNETGTPLSTTAGDWSVTGMTSGNSDAGKVWAHYLTSDSTLRFYKSESGRDSQDDDDEVARVTNPGTSSAFTTEANASGITITGKTGGTLNNGDQGNVDFQAPSDTTPADRVTLTISETTAPDVWGKTFRDGGVGGAPWRPHAASGANLVAGWIEAGMILPGCLRGDGLD